MSRRTWGLGAVLAFGLCFAIYSLSLQREDPRKTFLFEVYAANNGDRYTKYEEVISTVPLERKVGMEKIVQEALDAYYSCFEPFCTDAAFEDLLNGSWPMTLDAASAQNNVKVVPVSVRFSPYNQNGNRDTQYFDYELIVYLKGNAEEEEFKVLGCIATENIDGESVVSVHAQKNDAALVERIMLLNS